MDNLLVGGLLRGEQVEYYWPAWRAAAGGGKIKSVMCSYNAVNTVRARALMLPPLHWTHWTHDCSQISLSKCTIMIMIWRR